MNTILWVLLYLGIGVVSFAVLMFVYVATEMYLDRRDMRDRRRK